MPNGSALQDQLIAEKRRLRAVLWTRKPGPKVVEKPPLSHEPVMTFAPLPKQDIKPLKARVAEAKALLKGATDGRIGTVTKAIHESAKDCAGLAPAKDLPKVSEIIQIVAAYFEVSAIDIISARRTVTVARPRQIAMYLAKLLTLNSMPQIGRMMGGRDHTTVLHSVQKMTRQVQTDEALASDIAALKEKIMT